VVRTKLESIATRNDGSSQGVRVMTLREGDKVAGIAAFRTGLAQRDASDAGGESDEAPARVAPAPRAKAARPTPAVKGATKAAPKSASKPPKATFPKGKGKPASKVKAKTKPTKRR
jgi:hypothetical protein